jgi:hypothetical protein
MSLEGNFDLEWENVETKIDGTAKLVGERVNALALDLNKNKMTLSIIDDPEGGVFTFLQKMKTDLAWRVVVRTGSYRLQFENTEIATHTLDFGSRSAPFLVAGISFNPGPVEHKLALKFKTWCKL